MSQPWFAILAVYRPDDGFFNLSVKLILAILLLPDFGDI